MAKKARKVKINDLGQAVQQILQEYGDNITEGTKRAVMEVAVIAKQETKSLSPYGKSKKHYRSGWAIREDIFDRFRTDAIVYNRTQYQLTHLLEHGHDVTREKGGPVLGHAEAHPHISIAEEHAIKNLEEAVKKIAENG